MTWLNRQIKEAQDTIVQLWKTKRLSKEINAKHFKECEAVEEKVYAALASVEEI
jgi:hypothetical protein